MSLTVENVDAIIGALEIAESESGGDYSEEKIKLLKIFPKVKKLRDTRDKKWDDEYTNQKIARKKVTDLVFGNLQKDQAVLPQLKSTMTKTFYEDVLRKSYSDDICLSADLFKYHLKELKQMGLLKELREYLKIEGEKEENDWMKDDYKTTSDEDLWHDLARNLEKVRGV